MPPDPAPRRPPVLVVEDDPKLAALLCRALDGDGFAAEAVGDGETAVERLTQGSFCAVVLDVGLPRLGGLEVCARARRSGVRIPIVVLSARDSVEDVAAGRRAGASDYLLKPFSLSDLHARLRDLIDREAGSHGHLIGPT